MAEAEERHQGTDDKGVKKSFGDATEDSGPGISPFKDEKDQHGWAPGVGEASDEVKQSGDRAFEGRDTQDASKGDREDAEPAPGTEDVGVSTTEQGNERALDEDEAGRGEVQEGSAGRERGTSDARFSTGVGAERSESTPTERDEASGDQGG